jgi:hypothetical protein
MLDYFLSAIEVRTMMIQPLLEGDPEKKAVLNNICRDLEELAAQSPSAEPGWRDRAWCDAYRLDRMLAIIEPPEKLLEEVQRRLDEAMEEKVPTTARLNKTFDAIAPYSIDTGQSPPAYKPGGEARLRAFLIDVIEETQWHLKKKFTARTIQKAATSKVIIAVICSFVLFISPYAIIVGKTVIHNGVINIENWVGLPLWTALTAGLFGAFFSRLLFLQAKWNVLSLDELKDAREWVSIVLRGIVGMCGAAVVFFFLHAEVISGGLFPNFKELVLNDLRINVGNGIPMRLVFPNTHFALLIVWSFLAGFSERLVPSILQTTEATLGEGSTTK